MPLERGVRHNHALIVAMVLTGVAFVVSVSRRPWSMLLAGLVLAGLLLTYVLTNRRQGRWLSAINPQGRREAVERTRMQYALRESKELYRSLFDNMLNGFAYCRMIFDGEAPADFTYIEVNNAFERLTGLKNVAGKRVSEVIPGIRESNPELFQVYGRVALTGIPECFETWVEPLAQWFSVSVYSPGKEHFVAVFDVITERKRADEAVKRSEATLKSVLSASPVGIALCRSDRTVDWVNERLSKMTGYTLDEVRGRVPEFLYASADEFLRMEKELFSVVRAGGTGTAETRWVRKDGVRRDVHVSGAAIDPEDMSAGIVFTVEDITERKQAEEALRESETKLRAILENSRDAIGVSQAGIHTFVNPAYVSLFGYDCEDELLGMPIFDLIAPESRPLIQERVAQRARGEKAPSFYEISGMKKDGTTFRMETTVSTYGSNGATSSLVILRDITERKRAEELLRESEERHRVAIENSNEGIALVKEEGRIIFVNRRFCELLGYDDEEKVLGLYSSVFVHPSERERISSYAEMRKRGEQAPAHYEFKALRKDGAELDIEAAVALVSYRGERVSLVHFRDITEHKKAEQALRMNEKRLQTLMDAAPVGISWTDHSLRMVYCNRKFTELFGYTTEDIPTVADWRMRAYPDPKYREAVRPLVPAILEAQRLGRDVQPMEVMITCKDGSTRWVSQTGAIASDLNLVIYSDLSEQKTTEESLRESENKFRDLVEKANIGVFLVQGGLFRYVNARFAEIHGYEACEIIDRKGPLDVLVAEERREPQGNQTSNPSGRDDPSRAKEFTIMTKQGELRNVEVYSALTIYKGRKALIGTLLDVTERGVSEEALRRSQLQLSDAAALAHLAYWEADPETNEFVFSDAFYALFATTAEREGGYRMASSDYPARFVHPDDLESYYRHVESVNASRPALAQLEHRIIRRDGEVRHIASQSRFAWDESGRLTRVYGANQDITERRQAEELLKRIVASSPMGIFILQRGKTRMVNSQFENFTGHTQEEAMEMSLFDLVHPDDRAKVKELGRRMLKGELTTPYEYRIQTKSGEIRTLMETITPINYRGERAILGNVMNTTDRKMLESQLAQAQKLEAIGQLAAGIAHEINTPIQYVGDNVTFLRDAFQDTVGLLEEYGALVRTADEKPLDSQAITSLEQKAESIDLPYLEKEIPRAIEQSLEGIGKVAAIVRAMKEFSHPGTKEKSLIDINRAIENTITVSRNEWKYVSEMRTDFDPSLPPVPCLPGEFNQVILNIIVNAAQAMGDVFDGSGAKGTITVATRLTEDGAEIRISDTGPGIPDSIISRIFDPFFTTKEVGKGTGQGLAISRSVVVDKHGGTMRCETALGRGTTFVICLPLEDKRKGD